MEFHPLFLRYVIVFLSEFCMPYGGIILGRGKGRCTGSSDLIFLFRPQMFCSVSRIPMWNLNWSITGIFTVVPLWWKLQNSNYDFITSLIIKKVATTFSLPILKDYLLKIMYTFYGTVCFSLTFPVVAAVYMVMHAHAYLEVNISSYYWFFSTVESELWPEVCFICVTRIITKMCYVSHTLLLNN